MPNSVVSLRGLLLPFAALLVPAHAAAQAGETSSDLMFLPTLHSESRFDGGDNTSRIHYGAALFHTWSQGPWRMLGEIYLSDEERELERLQIGWRLAPRDTLWIGRSHVPLGYWNTKFHHGVHLQTAVHRPAIVEFEDEGGVLPLHATGLQWAGYRPLGTGRLEYSVDVGAGANLDGGGLVPYALVGENRGRRGVSSVLRLVYRPHELSASEAGAFLGHSPLPTEIPALGDIDQWAAGAFIHKAWFATRVTAAGFHVRNTFAATGTSASFAAGYLQAEHELDAQWLVYGRIEESLGMDDQDPYLVALGGGPVNHTLGGLRYDFARRQAISAEAAHGHGGHEDGWHISVQWSAVFP